jgi:folate-binding protein YgfZ
MSDLPYSTIVASGDDAFAFLQAQIAADLTKMSEGAPLLAAWCNPKGRVICLLRVLKTDDGYSLTLPSELTDKVVERLAMFRFRSKVAFSLQDATNAQLGIDGSYDEWRLENLRAGIPELLQVQSEEFTPHMLNLDLLGAVSVDKGCYPGQEIVARTHFRGTTRRRCLRFESAEPVSPGDKVVHGERDIGEVLNAIGKELLAVVPIDKENQELTVGGTTLVNCPLPYFQ